MSIVYAMIATRDLPAFDKGDVITILQDNADFGSKIKNNSKFRIVEIADSKLEDMETIVQPLIKHEGHADLEEMVKPRRFKVDVDKLATNQVSHTRFMGKVQEKPMPVDVQAKDVVV